jgi:hypothetical protein
MSWARNYYKHDLDSWQDRNTRGYNYKLCPYSTAYRDQFTYSGTVCTGIALNGAAQNITGVFVIGNSTNDEFHALPYGSYACSDHSTTGGRMVHVSNPPGWMCDDPNCYYFINTASGRRYREV